MLSRFLSAKSELLALLPALRSLMESQVSDGASRKLMNAVECIEHMREPTVIFVVGSEGSGRRSLAKVLGGEFPNDVLFEPAVFSEFKKNGCSSELVLFVLDASEPWESAWWESVMVLPDRVRKGAVVVVQKAELRSDVELQAICQHMRTVATRNGANFDVLPVSAKLAARPGGVPQDTGMGKLVSRIGERIATQSGVQEAIKLAVSACAEAMEAMEAIEEEGSCHENRDDSVVNPIGDRIRKLATGMLGQLPDRLSPVLVSLDRGVMDCVVAGEKQLTQRGRNKHEQLKELEVSLNRGLEQSIERATGDAADRMEAHLDRSWEHLCRHLREHYGHVFDEAELRSVDWGTHRETFLRAARDRIQNMCGNVRIVGALQRKDYGGRELVVGTVMLLAASSAAAAFLAHEIISIVCAGAVLVPVALAKRGIRKARDEAAREFWAVSDAHREKIEQACSRALKDDTERYTEAFMNQVERLANNADLANVNDQSPARSELDLVNAAILRLEKQWIQARST